VGAWRQAATVALRHPWAVFWPSLVLGVASHSLNLLPGHHLLGRIAAAVAAALVFNLYVAYAELLLRADEEGERRIRPRRQFALLRRSAPAVPAILLAGALVLTVPFLLIAALVIPGVWLLTRWALFVPVLVHERRGPMQALGRSAELVRPAFELVLLSATFALFVDEAFIHAAAVAGALVLDSGEWGPFLGAAVTATIVTPFCALTVAVAYSRVRERDAGEREAEGRLVESATWRGRP
jgi:hypothetical protein